MSSSQRSSRRLRNQVVVGVADDLDRGEFAHGKLALDVNAPVDVGSIGFAPRYEVTAAKFCGVTHADVAMFPGIDLRIVKFARGGLVFGQDLQLTANVRAGHARCDFMLQRHGTIAALALKLASKLPFHFACACAFLLGIGKDAEPFKACLTNELKQRLETR